MVIDNKEYEEQVDRYCSVTRDRGDGHEPFEDSPFCPGDNDPDSDLEGLFRERSLTEIIDEQILEQQDSYGQDPLLLTPFDPAQKTLNPVTQSQSYPRDNIVLSQLPNDFPEQVTKGGINPEVLSEYISFFDGYDEQALIGFLASLLPCGCGHDFGNLEKRKVEYLDGRRDRFGDSWRKAGRDCRRNFCCCPGTSSDPSSGSDQQERRPCSSGYTPRCDTCQVAAGCLHALAKFEESTCSLVNDVWHKCLLHHPGNYLKGAKTTDSVPQGSLFSLPNSGRDPPSLRSVQGRATVDLTGDLASSSDSGRDDSGWNTGAEFITRDDGRVRHNPVLRLDPIVPAYIKPLWIGPATNRVLLRLPGDQIPRSDKYVRELRTETLWNGKRFVEYDIIASSASLYNDLKADLNLLREKAVEDGNLTPEGELPPTLEPLVGEILGSRPHKPVLVTGSHVFNGSPAFPAHGFWPLENRGSVEMLGCSRTGGSQRPGAAVPSPVQPGPPHASQVGAYIKPSICR